MYYVPVKQCFDEHVLILLSNNLLANEDTILPSAEGGKGSNEGVEEERQLVYLLPKVPNYYKQKAL